MEFPRKNSKTSWMKYIYFCLYSLFLSSCFHFWLKASVYIWVEISLLQSVHNVASWLDPPTITFFKKFIYIAGKFFKTCNFVQIVSVFLSLSVQNTIFESCFRVNHRPFRAQIQAIFSKISIFSLLWIRVPIFFKGIHFRLLLGKVEVWKNREDLSVTLTSDRNPSLYE